VGPQVYAFSGLAAVLTLIPGADTALVTRNTLSGGRRGAFFTTLGICTGLTIHATASALGLSAILRISSLAYGVVKFAGAGYLLYLGIQTLGSSAKSEPRSCSPHVSAESLLSNLFRQGLITNVLNPKVALFYLTVLPQFVSPQDSVLLQSFLLAGIHIAMGLVWLSLYAYFLSGFQQVMNRPAVRRGLERLTGALFIGLGLRLAWEKR
jgi:threonine/homoserine/homoserine lactone efflux protein